MEKEFQLKRCPFCGNPNVMMRKFKADGVNLWRDRYAVLCPYYDGGCGAEGGVYPSTLEAVAAWNQRKRKWEA